MRAFLLALGLVVAAVGGCEPSAPGAPAAAVPLVHTAVVPLAASPPSASAPPPLGVESPSPTAAPPVVSPADPCSAVSDPPSVPLPEPTTFGDFWTALGAQIDMLDLSALRPSYEAFTQRRGIDAQTPGLWDDFARLWIAFEATRDGGWWRLRWDVTNQQPSSVRIWKAWFAEPPELAFARPSATAECDEISALFALTAKRAGVRGVGLFYPTWNHTIAAWAPVSLRGTHSRVVLVPTTQIFLGCTDTVDQTSFETHLTRIGEYPRYDLRDSTEVPTAVARFLLEQVRDYGEASPSLLALIRLDRARIMGSSVSECSDVRRQLAERIAPRLGCGDRRALRRVAAEAAHPDWSDAALLAWLAEP